MKTPESILAAYDNTGAATIEELAWALRAALKVNTPPERKATDLTPRKKCRNKAAALAELSGARSRLKTIGNSSTVDCAIADIGVAEAHINRMPDDDKLASLATLVDSLNDQRIYSTVNTALAQLLAEASAFIKEEP